MQKTWKLEDVIEIGKMTPFTFYLPSKFVTDNLKPGNVVKLMFACAVENDKGWSAERMWVIITDRNEDNFTGTLDNVPHYIPDLKYKDIIEFKLKHIMQTDLSDPEPDIIEKYLPRCCVTSEVFNDLKPVGHLYREHPKEGEENYSGWNLFSGEESEEYLNNPDNWNYVSLGSVLNKCDRFIDLLDLNDYENEYAWDAKTQSYHKI